MISTTFVQITDTRYQPVSAGHRIITSLEGENPGKSIKDRMVFGELTDLIHTGAIKAGDAIAEISAGSTALSLAYYCHFFQLKCSLFVPLTLDPELSRQLSRLGAELHSVDPSGAYEKYDEFIRKTGIRKLDQFGNLRLRRHYFSLGQSLGQVDSFSAVVGAVGTGHSLLGLAPALNPGTQLISAEPLKPGTVSGVRNLRLENFGDKDPVQLSQLQRFELDEDQFYPFSKIETDHGLIEFSDSFRLVLGAVEMVTQGQQPTSVFALGAKNSRCGSSLD